MRKGPRSWRLVLIFAAFSAAWMQGTALPHSALVSSEPKAGETLEHAPDAVSITFTEEPDPDLSSIKVLDSNGSSIESGKASPNGPATLQVKLKNASDGVFTVTWRALSKVDGHTTVGSFAYGVGVTPSASRSSNQTQTETPTSPTGLAGRWLFYLGTVAMIGFGATAQLRGKSLRGAWVVAPWVVALGGAVLIALGQMLASGVSVEVFLQSDLGWRLLWRASPLLVVAAVALIVNRPGPTVYLLGIGSAISMYCHAAASHAAAGGFAWAKIGLQTVHMISVGVWIGGLASLLLTVRGPADAQKARLVSRFSRTAGFAFFAVGGTGMVRAIAEVGGIGHLFESRYGWVVAGKSALFGVLGVLGAMNRYKSVPAAIKSLTGLRKIGASELGIATATLGLAAFLASTSPPSRAPAAAPNPKVEVVAQDFSKSTRIRLAVTPGLAGPNKFDLRLTDFDTRKLQEADRVSIRFTYLSEPGVGESTLSLQRRSKGLWRAEGTNLSIEGRWRLVALVERGEESVEIPFEISTLPSRQKVAESRVPNGPTVYTATLDNNRSVQIYLKPFRPGDVELHVTYFGKDENEAAAEDSSIILVNPRGNGRALASRRFSKGHFVADATLASGSWTVDAIATMEDGGKTRVLMTIKVPSK